MDFLLEPIITIDTHLLPDPGTTTNAACCSSGSGCSSGMAQQVETEEV
jgi:hypothetical protein